MMNSLKHLIIITILSQFLCCCTVQPGLNDDPSLRVYTIYIINRDIHTGLIIPVNAVSRKNITALMFFENAAFIDFGWGEEVVYQTPNETFCMDVKAVTIPSSSVMCAERLVLNIAMLAGWSDYAVEFKLTEEEFGRICMFVDKSFTRDPDGRLVKTSVRSRGDVIYFKSVHTYCLFNTCNTWIAEALSQSVPGISPFMVITRRGLYDEIKDRGTVLKSWK